MKIGDRDTPGTRIYAEREFRDDCQVLVATEAAGEGINLQFCWFMINYDIPWNPVRLEQRMGRIHRYGQEKDCLIFNFVSTNTREGRVLQKLFERLDADRGRPRPEAHRQGLQRPGRGLPGQPAGTHAPRDVRAQPDRAGDPRPHRRRKWTPSGSAASRNSTLEGLAKRDVNLSAIVGKSAEAKERRLVPEVIEEFFLQAGPLAGINPRSPQARLRSARAATCLPGRPGAAQSVADRRTAGAALRQAGPRIQADRLRQAIADRRPDAANGSRRAIRCLRRCAKKSSSACSDDLRRGAVFYDLQRAQPARLDVFSAAIRDGRGNVLHRRLFVVEAQHRWHDDGPPADALPRLAARAGRHSRARWALASERASWPDRTQVERALIEQALQPFLDEISAQHAQEVETITRHMEISLNELIDRQQRRMIQLLEGQQAGRHQPAAGREYEDDAKIAWTS